MTRTKKSSALATTNPVRPEIPRARLDPDKTCKPKTELRGVILSPSREGTCFASPAVAHVDLETGVFTWLYELRRAS